MLGSSFRTWNEHDLGPLILGLKAEFINHGSPFFAVLTETRIKGEDLRVKLNLVETFKKKWIEYLTF